jgi:hypothetical protein
MITCDKPVPKRESAKVECILSRVRAFGHGCEAENIGENDLRVPEEVGKDGVIIFRKIEENM